MFSIIQRLSPTATKTKTHFLFSRRCFFFFFFHSPAISKPTLLFQIQQQCSIPTTTTTITQWRRLFSSQSKFTNTTTSFDWSSDEDDNNEETKRNPKVVDKSKLPLSKKKHDDDGGGGLEEEPSELQEALHKATTMEGLKSHVVKMLDGLCIDDGLIHEALKLISFMKDNQLNIMPDVVVHTAVVEAFSNYPGHSKQALRSYKRMLASGVLPNAYTYSVLIRGLARDGKLAEARKYVLEMMGRGMRPNAGTYGAVLEAFVREGKEDEGRALLEEMKSKGFVLEEKSERLQRMREQFPVFRDAVMRIFSR
ncbi:hypothetical protein QJS10_CPA16g01825 [Acorus calamus]|uniref:PROP1-like PPR domain-containing protein n=1 Tax=Acorus calamus TaxID=4465 RepID=A0AAV9D278_ACOCL|nr:hypothetical protein QJS10_CPA16g01825 [Acorus calamus]